MLAVLNEDQRSEEQRKQKKKDFTVNECGHKTSSVFRHARQFTAPL